MKQTLIFAIAVCCVSSGTLVFGHHGHEQHGRAAACQSIRTWADAAGGFQVDASFVMARDGNVQLRRKDDSLIALPIATLSDEDQAWLESRLGQLRKLNTQILTVAFAQEGIPAAVQKADHQPAPSILQDFQPFADRLKFRWDDTYFYVESNGLPDHQMMVGITAWQQQVPIPQPYKGNNAWQIPLHPVPAKEPMSAKTNFFRGAIALAVNGVPIFNPIKNDGRTDTLLAGELDEFGGHCGRADDYHYHVAPVHLEKQLGKGQPVAYALDGYPIYGYDEPDGSKVVDLDWLNGHRAADGNYHYHATKTYPYLNGGFYGEVVQRGGQVDPQPRARGVRPYTRPLRGAKITGFTHAKPNEFSVEYELHGERRSVDYTVSGDGSVQFRFVSPSGTTTETYQPRSLGRRNGRPDERSLLRAPAIMRALDTNRDGTIDRVELARVEEALRSLDRNRDGKLVSDELRGPR